MVNLEVCMEHQLIDLTRSQVKYKSQNQKTRLNYTEIDWKLFFQKSTVKLDVSVRLTKGYLVRRTRNFCVFAEKCRDLNWIITRGLKKIR